MSDDLLDSARQALACLKLANGNWLCADHRKFWEIVHANLIEFLRALVEQAERIKELEYWHALNDKLCKGQEEAIKIAAARIKELEAAIAPTPRTYEHGVRDAIELLRKKRFYIKNEVPFHSNAGIIQSKKDQIQLLIDLVTALSALPAKEANGE